MNLQKFTEKSLEAVQEARSIAESNSNQMLEQEHMIMALCKEESGLISQLLTKVNVQTEKL